MYLCYLDESGTPELGSQTSHFILVGLAIPATAWLAKDRRIDVIKARYGLERAEIHAGYLARRFPEQEKVFKFDGLDRPTRRATVQQEREKELIRTTALKEVARLKALKKLYRKTADYIHLSYSERRTLLRELADEIGSWADARLFGEAIDKRQLPNPASSEEIFSRAFLALITKFNRFLESVDVGGGSPAAESASENCGLLIEDNNETVARKITDTVRQLHGQGHIVGCHNRIIETPLFVESSLTSMVQMADLCAYATRRYVENGETDVFDRIFPRAEFRTPSQAGLYHYTGSVTCQCKICKAALATHTV